jgi:hypothetical protein
MALLYGVALAALSFLLAWFDYRHMIRAWSTEFYILCIALLFTGLGPRARAGPVLNAMIALSSLWGSAPANARFWTCWRPGIPTR